MRIDSGKAREWRQMWPLPLVCMFGVSGSAVFSASNGVFMNVMMKEFGWNRTTFSSALFATTVVVLAILPLVGRAIDRFGPRKVALCAIIPAAFGPGFLGLANGNMFQWWLVAILQAIPCVIMVPTLWLTAVVGRFSASRGLALAVVLAGSGLATGLYPILASYYIQTIGWRLAWGAIGLTWGVIAFPLAFFFFYDARDTVTAAKTKRAKVEVPPYGHILRSRAFIFLTAGGVMFVWASSALATQLVPILQWSGHSLTVAASLAGLLGLCAIAGRIGVGFLLDIVRTRPFAAVVFLLPVVVCLLLIYAHTVPVAIVAVMLLGFATGAELDIVTYMASRRFPHEVFASVYSVFQTFTAIASVIAMLGASALYDWWGSYSLHLVVMPILAAIASILITMVPEVGHRDIKPEDFVAEVEDGEELPATAQTA